MLNFAGCRVVESQGHSGGFALLWKNEGSCVLKESLNIILISRWNMIKLEDGVILAFMAARRGIREGNHGV